MKFILLACLFILVSCATQKESNLKVNSESMKLDSINVIKDETLIKDTIDTLIREELVEEMQIIRKDNINDADERKQNQLIVNHERKTKLKVIDKSSQKKEAVDTNSGWVAYSVPINMKVSKSYSVKVRISKRTTGQNKAVLILGNDDVINNPEYESIATIEDIRVSGDMSAELRGDKNTFSIVALSTEDQNIDNESYTEWEWVVVPKKNGESPLKLVIKMKDLNKDIVVFNKNIEIKSNIPVAVEGFFDKYWQWFMTTIIIPIFLYFWNRKKKRRQTKKS
jgi:hypothetical protein